MKRVNSNDIARLAGVSRSTVSRVINGYANVPPQTREKVMKVIKENHYYPLLSGQLLTGKPIKTLGLFMISSAAIAVDPLTSRFLMHVIDAAAERGYLVLCCILDNLADKKNVNHVRKIFMEGRIDAGVFININNHEPAVDELVELGKVVGLFDYYHEGEDLPNRITVNFDRNTGEKTIDYLHDLGHRRIAILDGDLSRISCIHRHESHLHGLMKHNLPMKNKWMGMGGIISESGYEGARRLLLGCMDDLPTAICPHNDAAAFGVYRACGELGLRIPEDLSVVGADGHENGRYTNPPLTTFAFDFREMFASLVSRVIDAVTQREDVPRSVFFESEFLERGSCRRIGG
ncbi:MAG: LacI family transcriptional regulator [Clostridiales bacterium]|nr:LacI family transcriptional regulator [Clostridiales bacterium]